MKQVDTQTLLVTTLMHNSGQWIESSAPIQPDKSGPQAFCSCLSYLRRYSLAAICGVITEDDDGEEAVSRPTVKTASKPTHTLKDPTDRTATTPPSVSSVATPLKHTAAPEFNFKIDMKQMNSSANCSPAQAQLVRTRMGVIGWSKDKQERFLTHIGCKNKDGVASTTLLMKEAVNQVLNFLDSQKD
jgi:hypothetical protein